MGWNDACMTATTCKMQSYSRELTALRDYIVPSRLRFKSPWDTILRYNTVLHSCGGGRRGRKRKD